MSILPNTISANVATISLARPPCLKNRLGASCQPTFGRARILQVHDNISTEALILAHLANSVTTVLARKVVSNLQNSKSAIRSHVCVELDLS